MQGQPDPSDRAAQVGKGSGSRDNHGPLLEEVRQDHAIRSSVAITKLPLGRNILKKKKKNKKEKWDFLKRFFLLIFLLSGLVIVHTASLLAQEHSYGEILCKSRYFM